MTNGAQKSRSQGGGGGLNMLPPPPWRDIPAEVRAGVGQIEWLPVFDDEGDESFERMPPAPGLLREFIRLACSDVIDNFVQYTRTYGVLGLTSSGLPGTYEPKAPPTVSGDPGWYYEPLVLWRAYSQSAKIILALALSLQSNEPVDERVVLEQFGLTPDVLVSREQIHWAVGALDPTAQRANWLIGGLTSSPLGSFADAMHHLQQKEPELEGRVLAQRVLETQRGRLAGKLQREWIDTANIVPVIEWGAGPAKLMLSLNPPLLRRSPFIVHPDDFAWPRNALFSVIAARLVEVVCGVEPGMGQCHHCLTIYKPQRKPPTGRPHYCSDECRQAARRKTGRNASNKYYAKEKAKQERLAASAE